MKHVIETGDQWILQYEKRNGIIWMGVIGNRNILIWEAGPVNGVPMALSSTQAELFGIAAPNEFLSHFMKFHKIESTSKCRQQGSNNTSQPDAT